MVYQVGVVQFNDFFARGDHELSHIYRVYNFQTTAWNKPNPSNDPMHGIIFIRSLLHLITYSI